MVTTGQSTSPNDTALLSPHHIYSLLSLSPSSTEINQWLSSLSTSNSTPPSTSSTSSTPQTPSPPRPSIKNYPDASYHTYLSLGIDLIYTPTSNTGDIPKSPKINKDEIQWGLDRIDVYNPIPAHSVPPPPSSSSIRKRKESPKYHIPTLPIIIYLPKSLGPISNLNSDEISDTSVVDGNKDDDGGKFNKFMINTETTGKDFVSGLGEPSRKGGATGWVGPYLEWTDLRIMIPTRQVSDTDLTSDDHDDSQNDQNTHPGDWEEVRIGIMVELRESIGGEITEEQAKKGLGGVWDRASGWEWGCIKFFRVGSTV